MQHLPGEGDEEIGADIAQTAHQKNEDEGGRQLQEELAFRGEAEILLFADLLPVVQEADRAEDQREAQYEDMCETAVQHAREAQRETHERSGENEHHTAHRGRAALGLMPGGTLLADLLSGLFLLQPGNIEFAERGGEQKRQHKSRYQLDDHMENTSNNVSTLLIFCAESPRRFLSRPYGAFRAPLPGNPHGPSRRVILHHRARRCQ